MFDSLPLLACFTYFLPTMVGISAGRETFNSIFLINLFFGWTGIGWLAAMVMAFRPEEHDIYDDINFRLTPFGAVRRAPIVLGNGAESVVKRIAASSVYVPPLRREI